MRRENRRVMSALLALGRTLPGVKKNSASEGRVEKRIVSSAVRVEGAEEAQVGQPARPARFDRLFHDVRQPADAGDIDVNDVFHCQCEIVRGYDSRAGEQDYSVGETVLAAQPGHKILKGALHGAERGRRLE